MVLMVRAQYDHMIINLYDDQKISEIQDEIQDTVVDSKLEKKHP